MASSLLVGSVIADNFGTFTMDFANVGIAGNAADVTGYGAVAYNYRIGKFEVTSDQFFGSGLGGTSGVNTPIASVNWYDAARFSNWLTSGNTNNGAYTISGGLITVDRAAAVLAYGTVYVLPTVDEFHKAAYFDASGGGAGYSKYADGTNTQPVAGSDVNYNSVNSAAWVVGSGYEEQNSTWDMMGNVWEWLETGTNATSRMVSGGAWNSDNQSIKNVGTRPHVLLDHLTSSLGFRVVSIPEPGTISLMGLSTISLFFTRTARRRKLAGRSLLPVRHEHFCDAYCSIDEWESSLVEEEEVSGHLDSVKEAVLPSIQLTWSKVCGGYKVLDRAFWNHMVTVHESRTLARKAFKKAFKQKILACFDGFLAFFMK